MIKITVGNADEYKVRFYHKHKKTTGKLVATCVVVELPTGLEVAATVKPRAGERTVSRAFGRFYAVRRLLEINTDFSRDLRKALQTAAPFPG